MIQKNKKLKSGFASLMATVIICAVLLLMVTTMSFNGFYGRFNILDSELKEKSFALAEACVDTAILKISNKPNYNPSNEVVAVGPDNCTIVSITNSGTNIKTKAHFNNAYTSLRAVINSTTFSLESFEECPSLTASTTSC